MATVVKAQGLRKQYGDFTAVDGIDLRIPRGVCFGLLGPNGAGKTTAIRMMQGISPVGGGTLEVLGLDAKTEARQIKRRIGVVPQEDNLDPDFRVRLNLTIYASYFDVPKDVARKRADELLAFVQLSEKADAQVEALSGGMRRRLVVARALMNDPDLLILDEPTTGLDPQARHSLWEKIRSLRRQGKTILLTTHYMDEAEMLCDWLVIMDHGKVLEEGSPKDLIEKHTGGGTVEFVCPDDEERLDAIEADLDRAEVRHERLPDRVIAFGSGLQDLQAEMRDRHDIPESVLRRATLEDVFLRLTGRILRE